MKNTIPKEIIPAHYGLTEDVTCETITVEETIAKPGPTINVWQGDAENEFVDLVMLTPTQARELAKILADFAGRNGACR